MRKQAARRGRGGLAVVFIALLLAALIPVGAIFIHEQWEAREDAASAQGTEESSSEAPSARPKAPAGPAGPAVKQKDMPVEPQEPALPAFGLVQEAQKAPESYFDDAVFFGDSLTEGLSLYSVLQNATFIASTGVNPDSVFSKKAILPPGEEERITMFQALGRVRPGKIYIMLGANYLGANTGISKKTFLSHYRAMLEKIREQHPDAILYIQSILPVSKEYEDNSNGNNLVGLDNQMINDYNEALMGLAGEMEAYYLDVHSAMVNDAGCLPSEETTDGMHPTPNYYARWYDYLFLHTIPSRDGDGEPEGEAQGARADADSAPNEAEGAAPQEGGESVPESAPQEPEAAAPQEDTVHIETVTASA